MSGSIVVSRLSVPSSDSEKIEADIELGSDGDYYIRRKVSAAELESLRKFSFEYDMSNSIFAHHGLAVDSSNDSKLIGRYNTRTITSETEEKEAKPKTILDYPPLFITFVSLLQLITFIYYALRSEEPLTLIGPVPYDSQLIYNPHRRYEIWRYLTYMLVHAGFWHISSNLLLQLIVGIPLELAHKFERVSVIYMGGVLAGSLGNSIADPFSYLAGASSGCYALVTAHIANLIVNWTEIQYALCKFLLISTFVFFDLGIAIYERHNTDSPMARRTSYGGHLAGMLGGLLLGILTLRNIRLRAWESFLWRFAFGAFFVLTGFAIFINIKESSNTAWFTPPDKRELNWATNPFAYQREH